MGVVTKKNKKNKLTHLSPRGTLEFRKVEMEITITTKRVGNIFKNQNKFSGLWLKSINKRHKKFNFNFNLDMTTSDLEFTTNGEPGELNLNLRSPTIRLFD